MVESRQILSPMTQWNKMQITLITDSLGNLCTCFDRMAKTTWWFPFGSPFQTCLSHRLILRIKQNNWEEGRCFSFKWQTDAKSWLTGKYPDSGKDWRQEEKGTIEDEMVGWYHRLNRHEFEQTPESWWWTGKPDVLQTMGSKRVGHDWATELNWPERRYRKG